jgi:hypothetical protein
MRVSEYFRKKESLVAIVQLEDASFLSGDE